MVPSVPMATDFDPNQVIAGFPLVKIRGALSLLGLMDDRDDVAEVAKSLLCHAPQAIRVLEELERQGFVARTAKARQWQKTERGRELAYHWHPPRKMDPVIERETERGVYTEVFDSVPCSILRSVSEGDMFEEADLQVGTSVEYESERLIEISISQPDDYDNRESSSLVDRSVYIGITDAKKFADALQKSTAKAERELVRRAAKKKAKDAKRAEIERRKPRKKAMVAKPARTAPKAILQPVHGQGREKQAADASGARVPAQLPAASGPPNRTDVAPHSDGAAKEKERRNALSATLKELRGKK